MMIATSTLAASCAALSSALVQLLSDTGNFARRVRDARHDINAINAELLAIKTSLEIAQDDFASTSTLLPAPLLEALVDVVECCGNTSVEVYKVTIKSTEDRSQRKSWDANKKDVLTSLRRKLEVLHVVLDLALDHISIFTLPPLRSNSPSNSQRNEYLKKKIMLASDLKRRIETEKFNVVTQPLRGIVDLERWLAELGVCAQTIYEGFCADEAAIRRSDSPLEVHDIPQCGRPGSAQSTDTDIGNWIDHVILNVPLNLMPIERPDRNCSSGYPDRTEVASCRLTFYTESDATESIYTEKFRKYKSRPRSIRPRHMSQDKELPKTPFFEPPTAPATIPFFAIPTPPTRSPSFAPSTAPTTTSLFAPSTAPTAPTAPLTAQFLEPPTAPITTVSVRDKLRPHINEDKVAIARSRRGELSPFQIFELDSDLRIISPAETYATVQRLLYAGADPNIEDPEFGFLFIRAAFKLPPDILRLLVEYGADITQLTSTKYHSVIHAAVLGKRHDNLRCLLSLGLPIDTPNSVGETALHFAAKTQGAFTIAKYLLEMGAEVDAEAMGAGTPLHMALVAKELDARERSAMMGLLMAHGARDELNPPSAKMRGKGLSVLGLI